MSEQKYFSKKFNADEKTNKIHQDPKKNNWSSSSLRKASEKKYVDKSYTHSSCSSTYKEKEHSFYSHETQYRYSDGKSTSSKGHKERNQSKRYFTSNKSDDLDSKSCKRHYLTTSDDKATSKKITSNDNLRESNFLSKFDPGVSECKQSMMDKDRRSRNIDSSKSSDSESFSEDESDPNFNWENYRSSLNRIFFREKDIIKRGSKDYEDFWNFVKKFQIVQKKKMLNRKKGGDSQKTEESQMGDIKSSVVLKDVEKILATKGAFEGLSIKKIAKFYRIIQIYFDFLEKQKLAKLAKLKESKASLPIAQYKQTIIDTVKLNQVIIVAGDTGCGKSTQVPQYLVEAGYNKVSCTQPRRIACISLCKRVSFEMLDEGGSLVGFQIRFDKSKTMKTKVLFLTEGLLLRQITSDPLLSLYDVIVLDEVHERHLHGDFLLGVVRCLIQHRSDLKVILMSATINIQLFTSYFGDAPVIQIPGRLYAIKLNYFPISLEDQTSKTERINPSPYLRIMQLIDHKYPITERGDLLIFLSGITEITTILDAARIYAQQSQRWIILPLHSTLSLADQDKVFDIAPEGVRKCIVSTNIAETSITIDGIRFVVDSGKLKEMNFDPTCKMQRLQEFSISKASAEQRKGRAGRTGPGVCYRLYSEKDYEEFSEYATPEIQRVPLDSLVLQMIAMGLPDARKFPFIESPPASSINNSIIFLKEQGAITENETITPIGQLLSQLPVDVVIGKMLIMGSLFYMIDPVLSIAAALSVQSPFTNRAYRDSDIMLTRRPLDSDHGDPFTLLNVYIEWLKLKASHDSNTKKWCKKRGIEEQRLYELTKLKQQFKTLLQDHHLLEQTKEHVPSTSAERQRRFGELRRLRGMKRNFHQNPRKKKFLKLDAGEDGDSGTEEEQEKEIDIKDVEFRLINDKRKLQDLAMKTQLLSLREISLLKVILCSGLYPQFSIPDEYNSYKKDSDQVMHTKSKPYVILHPNSILATQPDLLKLEELDIYNSSTEVDMKHPMSHKHQLVVFVSLLETTKPYLINNMRVPALQMLALFAHTIDSDASCSRLVFDEWLEVNFLEVEDGQKLMAQILDIRSVWSKLLSLRLQDKTHRSEDSDLSNETCNLGHHLANKIIGFFHSHWIFSIKRILAADLNNLYVGPGAYSNAEMKLFYSGKSNQILEGHPVKGGIAVTDFFNYNCLCQGGSATFGNYGQVIQTQWTCPVCETPLMATILERLQHEIECSAKIIPHEVKGEDNSKPNPLQKPYTCPDCQKEFLFTSTEILKHKKSHKPQEIM